MKKQTTVFFSLYLDLARNQKEKKRILELRSSLSPQANGNMGLVVVIENVNKETNSILRNLVIA